MSIKYRIEIGDCPIDNPIPPPPTDITWDRTDITWDSTIVTLDQT